MNSINNKQSLEPRSQCAKKSFIKTITTTLLLAYLTPLSALAQTTHQILFPNGEYTESTIDMRVKALGGEVKLNRTWQNSRWYINPAWSNLRFIADPLDNSIKVIDRAGTLYERSGDSDIFISDQVFIRKTDDGWRWYDRKGNWITYDNDGRVTAYGDANDVQVRFILDEEGRRSAIHDHFNQLVYQFEYDENERLIKVTDRTGRAVEYHWNNDNLVKITDVMGNDWLYDYDKNGQLTQRTEPDGGSIKIDYNYSIKAPVPGLDSGKFASQLNTVDGLASTKDIYKEVKTSQVGKFTDKTGAITLWNIQYDKTKQQYTVSEDDPLGKKTVTQYNAQGQLLSRYINGNLDTKIEYDNDYIKNVINQRGISTVYHYDNSDNLTKIIYPDGSNESYEYDYRINKPIRYADRQGVITEWFYDSKGNLTQQVEAVNNSEKRVTNFEVDEYGQLIEYNYANDEAYIAVKLAYDSQGNIVIFTDGEENIHHYQYTITGNVSEYKNPLGNIWKFDYDTAGNLIAQTTPLNHTTHYKVDEFSRIKEIEDSLGNISNYEYNFSSDGWVVHYTNPLNEKFTYYYDIIGRPIKSETPSGFLEQLTYNNEGKAKELTNSTGNHLSFEYGLPDSQYAGQLVAVQYPTYKETFKYNNVGLVTETRKISGDQLYNITSFNYNFNGETLSITKPGQVTTLYEYDAFGNVIKQKNVEGHSILQTWNIFNKLNSVTDSLGNIHQYSYDRNGRLKRESRPSGKVIDYEYDSIGKLVKKTDAAGNITHFTYDPAGQMIKKTITKNGEIYPEQAIDYQYNKAGQLIEIKQTGSTNSHFIFTFDPLGRIIQEKITYNKNDRSFTKILKYSYDRDGNKISLTYPDDNQMTVQYENSLLTQAVLPNNKTIHWQQYQWLQPTEVIYPASMETIQYNALLKPLKSQVKVNDNTLMERSIIYNESNNVAIYGTEYGEFNYQYDKLNRLTQAIPSLQLQRLGLPIESYNYDEVNNRIGSAHQPGEWQYNEDNQLLKWGLEGQQAILHYDDNGNLFKEIRDGKTFDYIYDGNNRLSSIEVDGVVIVNYQYDPMGRRISKTIQGETIWYLYTNEGLIAELDENGNMLVAYGWQLGSNWGTNPLWMAKIESGQTLKNAEYHYLHTDYLGVPQVAIDDTGQQTWKGVKEAFGKFHIDADSKVIMNLRLPGQYFDSETATHYNYRRNYQPETGRYIQRDPLQLYDGINVYNYAEANPLLSIDPLGLAHCTYIITTQEFSCTSTKHVFECTNEPDPDKGVRSSCGYNTYKETASIDKDYVHSGIGDHINNPDSFNVKDEGPIPPGNYIIRPNTLPYKEGWWQLKPTSWIPYYDSKRFENGEIRSGFNLHQGSYSHGCITVNSIASDQYEKIADLLKKDLKDGSVNTLEVRAF